MLDASRASFSFSVSGAAAAETAVPNARPAAPAALRRLQKTPAVSFHDLRLLYIETIPVRTPLAPAVSYPLVMHRAAGLILLFAFSASAQSIQYSESRKIWLLTTRQSSYAMGLGADGALRHLYWGAPLWRADDLAAPPARRDISSFDPRQMLEAEEFPGWGGPRYYEPALKVTRENGNRDLVLRYVSHRIAGNDLDIVLEGSERSHRSHAPLPRLSRSRHPAPQRHDS